MNQIDLKGRVAVVTGGANGIGASVASRFRQSGARVATWDIEQISIDDDETAFAQSVDIIDEQAVRDAAQSVRQRWGQIDILVNSAGIAGPTATSWDYPIDAWRRVQTINVEGTLLCCQAIVPLMIEQNYGRIVNISSIAGKEGNPNASAYSASKAAIIALTKSMGKELALNDIAVNCITPVTAETRILKQVSEEFVAYMRGKIPRNRFVTVEEIAGMIAWMCSQENSFATGAVFDLSGGRATY